MRNSFSEKRIAISKFLSSKEKGELLKSFYGFSVSKGDFYMLFLRYSSLIYSEVGESFCIKVSFFLSEKLYRIFLDLIFSPYLSLKDLKLKWNYSLGGLTSTVTRIRKLLLNLYFAGFFDKEEEELLFLFDKVCWKREKQREILRRSPYFMFKEDMRRRLYERK